MYNRNRKQTFESKLIHIQNFTYLWRKSRNSLEKEKKVAFDKRLEKGI